MTLLALLMGGIISGGLMVYGNQPLDSALVEQVSTEQIEQPLYEGWASWYDYTLNINGVDKVWSKTHDTCALRDKEHRYKTFKVCSDDKCITCYLNDYGPARQDRVIDLSSHAFSQLASLKKGLVYVKVYIVDE